MQAEYKHLKIQIDSDGIALIRMNYPRSKVNKLSTAFGEDMNAAFDQAMDDPDVKAVVLVSGKPDNFVVGADAGELTAIKTAVEATELIKRGQDLFNQIEASPKPWIAAIHGACMGGGLEMALACQYRIATDHPKTQLALPEVKLGILPAAGGCQRLPRLIGVQNALDMILTGKTVYPRKAKKLGLVDDVVVPYSLAEQAVQAAKKLLKQGIPDRAKKRSLAQQAMEDIGPARDLVLNKAAEMVLKKTKGNYPAPMYALECVRTGLDHGMEAGLQREAELVGQLVTGEVSKNLVRLFFAINDKKTHPLGKGAPEVGTVGVLGAGLMGAGVALVTATTAKKPVLLKDISDKAVAFGQKYAFKVVDKKHKKGAYGRVRRDQIMAMIQGVTDYDRFNRADLVVEAVFEDIELKKKVLAEAEAATGDHCVFATNTSAIPIHKIAEGAKRPGNVIGMHYFSPVHHMPLLEIITTEKTSQETVRKSVRLGLAQGKTIIVVKDGPGFYTTRILAPYLNEAQLLLEEGAQIDAVDKALESFGFPVGPLRLIDEIGIDVAAHVASDLGPMFKQRGGKTSSGSALMLEAGLKGRKTKLGFYDYSVQPSKLPKLPLNLFGGSKKPQPNEDAYGFFGSEKLRFDPEQLRMRCALAMVNEAAWCLQEQVIESPVDGDLGAILGLGFPPFLGGPFRYIDYTGVDKIVGILEDLAETVGPYFAPAQILKDYAKKGRRFYKK